MDEKAFRQILGAAVKHGASDIHFKAGMAPVFRVAKELKGIKVPKLAREDTEAIAKILVAGSSYRGDPNKAEIDLSYELPEVGRFRVNIFRQMGRSAIIMRTIPFKVPTVEELKLPPGIHPLADLERGLVLIAGITGSGKSSTLAALIDRINHTRKCHIITIEDPIEFVHADVKSQITQREVGLDTKDFSTAVRAAMRQDPDVILVGEMRDHETMDVAMKAAETGHLVFSSIHTPDVARTINRLVSFFPGSEQDTVRFRLAECLRSVVAQRLLPTSDGAGMIVACEIMISTMSIQDCLRDPAKLGEIVGFVEKGGELHGMQTFDQHLAQLYSDGKITLEIAKAASTNPSDFERALQFE